MDELRRWVAEHPERARSRARSPYCDPVERELLEHHLNELTNPFADRHTAAVEDEKLLEWALKLRQGAGRPESDSTAHIRQLLAEYPELAHKPRQLYALRNISIVPKMPAKKWGDKVAAARRK